MMKLHAIFTLFSACLLFAACGDPGEEPVRGGTPAIEGTMTHEGETKELTRATFGYSPESESYRIVLSPLPVEEGKTLEVIEIEIADVLMGSEWNLMTDEIPGQLGIWYRKDFLHYDPFMVYLNDGIDKREGTIEVSREGDYFEVTIKEMELHDGTILSCTAKGEFQPRLNPYMDGTLSGTADHTWVLEAEDYQGYEATIHFTNASLRMSRGYSLLSEQAQTLMVISGVSEDGDQTYSFSFVVTHPGLELVSKKYEIVQGEWGVDYAASTLSDVHCSYTAYLAHNDDTLYQSDMMGMTQGSLTIEVEQRYLKVTMPGDFDGVYEIEPAEFIFDLTNQ